jgi:hypothetical protein
LFEAVLSLSASVCNRTLYFFLGGGVENRKPRINPVPSFQQMDKTIEVLESLMTQDVRVFAASLGGGEF